MKTILPLYLLLLLVCALPAEAAFYQWTDANGVVHFTDNSDNIPAKYRKKAKKVKLQEEPAALQPPAPEAAQPPQPQAPVQTQELTPGGHDEKWWRNRLKTLQEEILTVQKRISEKQGKLVELRRKRAIYQRSRDREAVNAMETDIAADQSLLDVVQKRIEEYKDEAAKAQVPKEWLR